MSSVLTQEAQEELCRDRLAQWVKLDEDYVRILTSTKETDDKPVAQLYVGYNDVGKRVPRLRLSSPCLLRGKTATHYPLDAKPVQAKTVDKLIARNNANCMTMPKEVLNTLQTAYNQAHVTSPTFIELGGQLGAVLSRGQFQFLWDSESLTKFGHKPLWRLRPQDSGGISSTGTHSQPSKWRSYSEPPTPDTPTTPRDRRARPKGKFRPLAGISIMFECAATKWPADSASGFSRHSNGRDIYDLDLNLAFEDPSKSHTYQTLPYSDHAGTSS